MEIIRLKEVGIKKAVQKASDVLRKGGIIVYPTDTVYGVGVDARNATAVANLKQLKGRETKKPISIIVKSVEDMARYGELNELARKFAASHLPGPLTLVLPANPLFPLDVQLHGTIGVRIPKDEFCTTLAKAYGGPITTTSANRSGLSQEYNVQGIIWQFGPQVALVSLVIDAGELPKRPSSTVISCLTETPYVLREGALSREQLGL